MWRGFASIFGKVSKERTPFAVRMTDNFVACALAPNVFVGGYRGKFRNADCLAECLCLAFAIVFVDDHAGNTDIATEFSKVFDGGANVIRHVERLKVI